MSMMKTNLTLIPMCPQEHFALNKSLSRLVLCYKKDWATLFTFVPCYPLRITLSQKLSVTDNFSACRENLTDNHLSFPSAPRWVRHSYLSKGLRLIPYTCGSSGACLGPMQEMGMNFKHQGTVDCRQNIEIPGF